jgi:hypothetical protein
MVHSKGPKQTLDTVQRFRVKHYGVSETLTASISK